MDTRMIEMDLVQAKANLDYADNAFKQAVKFYEKREIDKATLEQVSKRAVQADIELCSAMLIASANGYKVADMNKIMERQNA